MNITPPPQGPPSVFLSSYADAGKVWKVGELLRAVAVKQTSQNQLTLQIGNQRYTAHAQAPVKTGKPLLLRVIRAGAQPVLEVVPERPGANPQLLLSHQSARAQNAPPPPLLSSLVKVATKPGQSQLPDGVIRAAQRLLESLPQARELVDGRQLRRMILNSGNFLESKLANAIDGEAEPSLSQDWKAGLLRFRGALRELFAGRDFMVTDDPKAAGSKDLRKSVSHLQQRIAASVSELETVDEPARRLLREVDEALIRIEVNQLSSRPTEDPGKQIWLLELPIQADDDTADFIRIRVERDASNPEDTENTTWRVSIQLELRPQGPITIGISLHQGQISAQFVADRPETAFLFQRHLHRLEKHLVELGLNVGVLSSRINTIPTLGGNKSGSLDILA